MSPADNQPEIVPTVEDAVVRNALALFGWDVSDDPDFWRRYRTDPWVFNLANAVARLTAADIQPSVKQPGA